MYAQTIIVLVKHWPNMIVQPIQECRVRGAGPHNLVASHSVVYYIIAL